MAKPIQWTDVKIENDVPIPAIRGKEPSPGLNVIDQLEINQSFSLPEKSFPTVRALVARYRKTRNKNKNFVLRKLDGTVRCWRVK